MGTRGSSHNPRRRLGDTGEALAVQTLEASGLIVITRNWRCPAGEIDIVAQEPAPDFTSGGLVVPWLVLVEVRTRRGDLFGTARQSLTPRKQTKLREVAGHYIQTQGWRGPWRIDLVAVQMDRQGRLIAIEHIRHAVTG
ncbi:MAG: YraN family protein [Chloroflexi bacterium]|nr:MAG: YraN family protein [Chloroflexota bacterium]